MYKIMLADDEGIVIDSLKFIIEKEFGDLCQVAFAKTGRSVIELAESFRPDIAIMDIQMPGINGIEAIKEIKKSNAHTLFIVMSAYDKFDYAQEAIKLGVREYISKPMERTKLVEVLKKAMATIDQTRERRSKDLLIREKLETVIPIIETGLIYNILFQEHFEEDVENYRNILDMHQEYAYMVTMVFGDDQEGVHMTNAVGSSVRVQRYYQEIRGLLKEFYHVCIVGTVMGNKIAVMVPHQQQDMDYNERIELIERTRELVRQIRKKTEISCRIGIGGVKEIHEMRDSYHEALHALLISTYRVSHADDLPIRCEYTEDYPIYIEKKLFAKIEAGELEEAYAAGEAFFDWMVRSHPEGLMDIRLKSLEFVLWAERIAYQAGGMIYQLNARQDYLPEIMAITEYGQLRQWFLEKIAKACRDVMYKKTERSRDIIQTAKEYIKQNYSKDVSLDDVSRLVNISPYYFSKLFKENTGEGFVEYLTEVRIEKAKELLPNSEYSMKEICVMIGYGDPNYFSRSFKKKTGVTPTEYREGKCT